MNILEIVENYLKDNNYDGLYLYDGDVNCGCDLGDLAPCEEMSPECEAAYKRNGMFYSADIVKTLSEKEGK